MRAEAGHVEYVTEIEALDRPKETPGLVDGARFRKTLNQLVVTGGLG